MPRHSTRTMHLENTSPYGLRIGLGYNYGYAGPSDSNEGFDRIDDGDHSMTLEYDGFDKQVTHYADALDEARARCGYAALPEVIEVDDAEVAALIGGPVEGTFPEEVLQS